MRTLTKLAGTAVLAAAVSAPLAATANAAPLPTPDDCSETGTVCVWEHSNYQGRFFIGLDTVANLGETMNDKTTSLWNRTDKRICFYEHTSFGGDFMAIVQPGDYRANVGPGVNDKISSWRPC